jgi:predicted ATPase
MARLTSVTVRRFKRIEDLTVDLDDVTLLIGANNSGKSSILQAIHFAVSIAQTAKLVGEGVSWRSRSETCYRYLCCRASSWPQPQYRRFDRRATDW